MKIKIKPRNLLLLGLCGFILNAYAGDVPLFTYLEGLESDHAKEKESFSIFRYHIESEHPYQLVNRLHKIYLMSSKRLIGISIAMRGSSSLVKRKL